jgi:hypothetical protein
MVDISPLGNVKLLQSATKPERTSERAARSCMRAQKNWTMKLRESSLRDNDFEREWISAKRPVAM